MHRKNGKIILSILTLIILLNVFLFEGVFSAQINYFKQSTLFGKKMTILPSVIEVTKRAYYKDLEEFNYEKNSKEAIDFFKMNINLVGVNHPKDLVDSDWDCLSDSYEKRIGTNAYSVDSDHDGLWDCEETGDCYVNYFVDKDGRFYADCFSTGTFVSYDLPGVPINKRYGKTNPLTSDTDLDGLNDFFEVAFSGFYTENHFERDAYQKKYTNDLQKYYEYSDSKPPNKILVKEIYGFCNEIDRQKGKNLFGQACILDDSVKKSINLIKDYINKHFNENSRKYYLLSIYTAAKVNFNTRKKALKMSVFSYNSLKYRISNLEKYKYPPPLYFKDNFYVSTDYLIYPNKADTDNDGASDKLELILGTQSNYNDTDLDKISDGEESALGLNPLSSDSDGDELDDYTELKITHTDPLNPNTDGDNLRDGDEVNYKYDYQSGQTKLVHYCDPLNPDTDGDGLIDGCKGGDDEFLSCEPSWVSIGSQNFYPCKNVDSDHDGLPDPKDPHPLNPKLDFDDDGLTDDQELKLGTNPSKADSDGDGLNDGDEINKYGTNATNPDTDDDGLNDYQEISIGTDPKRIDSDDDGLNDGDEKKGILCYRVLGINDNGPIIDTFLFSSDPTKADTDGDGWDDLTEFEKCTNGYEIDNDGDDLSDPQDPWPWSRDGDFDGIYDKDEISKGLDPRNPDQDNDGIIDGRDKEIKTRVTKNVLTYIEREKASGVSVSIDGCDDFKDTKYGLVCYVKLDKNSTQLSISYSGGKLKLIKYYSQDSKTEIHDATRYSIRVNDHSEDELKRYLTITDKCRGTIKYIDSNNLELFNLENAAKFLELYQKKQCVAGTIDVSAYYDDMWIDTKRVYIVYEYSIKPRIEILDAHWVKIGDDYAKTGTLEVMTKNCNKLTIKTNAFINGKHEITLNIKHSNLFSKSFRLSPIPFESTKYSYSVSEDIKKDLEDKGKEMAREAIEDATNYHLTNQGKALLGIMDFAQDLKEKGNEIGDAAAKISMYKSTGAKIVYGVIALADTIEASVAGLSITKDLADSSVSSSNIVDDVVDKIKSYTVKAAKTYLKNKAEEWEKEARKTTMIYNIVAECCFDNDCVKKSTRVEGLGYEQ